MNSMRWRYFLVVFICVALLLLIYWWDILPLRRELAFTRQQEKELTIQLQKLYYQETSLEEKMAQLPETKNLLNEWQKKFIKQDDIDKLLKEIAALGKREKLQIKRFDPESPVQENTYMKQPFKMILVGDYSHTARFVEQIAALPWTVVVGNFSLTKLSADNNYSTVLEFYVYYLKEGVR